MTIDDIKEKLPDAEIVELNPDAIFVMLIKRNSIPAQVLDGVIAALEQRHLNFVILIVDDPEHDVKVLALPKDTGVATETLPRRKPMRR
jgi:hypothetical protein